MMLLYDFTPLKNPMIYYYILCFRSGLEDLEYNRRVKNKEELMKNASPLDYQRSVKINKIINKI